MHPDLPVTRKGQNKVMIMSVQNPKNSDKESVPFLIRVKTVDDAGQLKDKLEELKV